MIEPTFETKPLILIALIATISPFIVYIFDRSNYNCELLCGLSSGFFIIFVVAPFLLISVPVALFTCYNNYRKKYNIYKKIHKKEMEDFLMQEEIGADGKKD